MFLMASPLIASELFWLDYEALEGNLASSSQSGHHQTGSRDDSSKCRHLVLIITSSPSNTFAIDAVKGFNCYHPSEKGLF